MTKVPRLVHPLLADLPGIRHGFFTRKGGVSSGVYQGLNCGVGSNDDRSNVLENRSRAASVIGVSANSLATPYQVHGTDAVVVNAAWEPGKGPKADAVVTNRPGIAIGVGTADCGPILLADAKAQVIGAAHAGWRGALSGIVESAVAAMEELGADREAIVAVVGPTISAANYEVGLELRKQFIAANSGNDRLFSPSPRPDHAMFDLPAFILSELQRTGVTPASIDLCTYADPDRFFSYRRATHRGEPDYGRLLSAIVLEG
jgi:YfiH family protein